MSGNNNTDNRNREALQSDINNSSLMGSIGEGGDNNGLGGTSSAPMATRTVTVTETETSPATNEVLRLTLAARPTVRWDEGVVDNEGLGRKSSKRCCIFHKQRAFGESSTDSSDADSDDNEGGSGDQNGKKVARPKQGKKVPDYQRFHA